MNLTLAIFFLGGKNDQGRTLDGILERSDEWWEENHDFIQWVFPTTQPSAFNKEAPLLDSDSLTLFFQLKLRPIIEEQLLKSFERYLTFLGLQWEHGRPWKGYVGNCADIIKAENWEERKLVWFQYSNHNYLRITRVLTCLSLLDLKAVAKQFLIILSEIYSSEENSGQKINAQTFAFWNHALT